MHARRRSEAAPRATRGDEVMMIAQHHAILNATQHARTICSTSLSTSADR